MKKIFVVMSVMAVICFFNTSAQSAPPYWAWTYGVAGNDTGYSVIPTNDGGYIAAGSVNNDQDALILNLGADGHVIWSNILGDTSEDAIHDIKQTSDGGYIAVGWDDSFCSNCCGWSCGYYRINGWALRLNNTGDVIWQVDYSNSADRDSYLQYVQETSDGGYLIAGHTNAFGALNGNNDLWLIKVDQNGSISWQRTYGSVEQEWDCSLEKTANDGYIIAASTRSFGEGGSDYWILKLSDIAGNISVDWQKTYGGYGDDNVKFVEQTQPDNGFIVAGDTYSSGQGGCDAWLLKLNSSGNIIWQKTYGRNNDDVATSVRQTADGGYIVAGYTNSIGNGGDDIWLFRLDNNGNMIWEKTFGSTYDDKVFSMKRMTDGGYLLSGITNSGAPYGSDSFILKLDDNGSISEDCAHIYIPETLSIESMTEVVAHNSPSDMIPSYAGTYDPAIPLIGSSVDSVPVCYSGGSSGNTDSDLDGIFDYLDNCPNTHNPGQEDHFPPNGNGVGDACDCEGNFDCDGDVDGTDASKFKEDFGRSKMLNICPSCPGVVTTTTSTVVP